MSRQITLSNCSMRPMLKDQQETQQRLKQAMRQPNKRKLDKNW